MESPLHAQLKIGLRNSSDEKPLDIQESFQEHWKVTAEQIFSIHTIQISKPKDSDSLCLTVMS